MTKRVQEILSWYGSDNPGTRANLARLLNAGTLGGTGRLVILPVDQGFEHGPARSFAPNPAGYNPLYHFELAIETGCSAYAAPLGFLEAGAAEFAGEIPLILKLNNHDLLNEEEDPISAVTAAVRDALRLGCAAIGFTIYPGSTHRNRMYEQIAEIGAEAKAVGLAVVIWSYPRGSGLSRAGETALDVVAYAAQIAAQLGAHIIKVKLPTEHLELDAAKRVYETSRIPRATLAAGSSFSPAAPGRTTPPCSSRPAPSATAAGSARSSGAIPSSGRAPRPSGSWRRSWGSTRGRTQNPDGRVRCQQMVG